MFQITVFEKGCVTMRRSCWLWCMLWCMLCCSSVPVVGQEAAPKPTVDPVSTTQASYSNVSHLATHNIAPCATKKTVQIVDPCYVADPCNKCDKPKMVNVDVCVPSGCTEPVVTTSDDGKKMTLLYGRYRVRLVSGGGKVRVLYTD